MASSPNLELVGSISAVWERGDWSSAEWAHPEIEYVFADGPSPGRWTGHLIDVADRVVALIDQRMRGRSSAIDLGPGTYAQVYTFKDGLIVHRKLYMSQSEAQSCGA